MIKRLLFAAFIMALIQMARVPRAHAQDEVGRPFLTNYSPATYEAHPQNWAVVQDQRGVMYFANSSGILEYNGATWRLIALPNQSITRSLAVDQNGRIWVGGLSDFGYLAPDAYNQLQFVSMLDRVPEEHRTFNDVWQTSATPDGIYFTTTAKIFRWKDDRIQVFQGRTDFHMTFWVNNAFYVRQWGAGLKKVVGDSLVMVPGGEAFASERIYVMLPFDEDRILVGTRTQGLFLYDGTTFTPFRTGADAFLQANALYQPGAVLPGGRFVLGAISGGAVVIDRQGRLLQVFDRVAGLQDNTVLFTYVDTDGALWLGLDKGITRIDMASPLTVFGEEAGLTGSLFSIRRHAGRLTVGMNTGALWLDPETGRFNAIPDVGDQVFDMLSMDDQLLATSFDGVSRIDRGRAEAVRPSVGNEFNAFVFHRMEQDPSRVVVGVSEGVGIIRYTNGGWIDEGFIPGINQQAWTIIEDAAGDLWLGAGGSDVIRLHFPAGLDDLNQVEIERFGSNQGLPQGTAAVFKIRDQIHAIFKDGTFRLNADRSAFVPDTTFASISRGGDASEYVLKEDHLGRVWISFGQEVAVGVPNNQGGYRIDKVPFRSFAASTVFDIYPEEDGIVWFAGSEGLFRYDAGIEKDYAPAYSTLIRAVTAGEDSLLYGGALATTSDLSLVLEPGLNALRFEYGAPFYEQEVKTQYQTYLEGFEEHPSPWGPNLYKEYTNLSPGDYVFRVKAMNLYGHESNEALFAFAILPPWYRTGWAYALYVLLLGAMVYSAGRMQRNRLLAREEQRRRVLENTVAERTAEIQQRVEELAVINSVQEGLVAELDMQAIYDLVGDRIRDLFDAQVVVIRTYDLDANLEHYRYVIEKGERLYAAPSPIDGFGRYLINARTSHFINENFVDYIQQYSDRVVTEGEVPKSAIYVPMIVGDQVKGNVSLQNVDREHAFTESDVRLLTTLVNSMSVALENARLFDEANQRATEMATVNNISRALVSQLEFDALVKLIGDQMRDTFKADIVYVAFLDKETDTLNFPYGYGDDFPPIPFGEGFTSQIIRTGEPLLINEDVSGSYQELGIKEIGKRSASYLGVPVAVGTEVIGVISVQSTQETGRFDADDMRLLGTIAANVGVALANAEAYRKLNATVKELKSTQQQLVTQEKLASLGQLTAGVAHEIKNPLNFVNNFADLNVELADELREELQVNKSKRIQDVYDDLSELLTGLKLNAAQIRKHGRRADAIVKNMMEHASGGAGERYRIDVNTFVEEYVGLAYHGALGQVPGFSVELKRDYDATAGTVEMVPKEMGRVLVNLLNNAFDAVREQAQRVNGTYVPTVSVGTKRLRNALEIRISDNGPGIPDHIREKIFEPFFTTKPTGSGTGLGLSLSYDIVTQGHDGMLSVESAEGKGATFVISLPLDKTAVVTNT